MIHKIPSVFTCCATRFATTGAMPGGVLPIAGAQVALPQEGQAVWPACICVPQELQNMIAPLLDPRYDDSFTGWNAFILLRLPGFASLKSVQTKMRDVDFRILPTNQT